jgi:hypothetical protein
MRIKEYKNIMYIIMLLKVKYFPLRKMKGFIHEYTGMVWPFGEYKWQK